MTLRYLRMTAWSILLVYIPWEIASQPPLALLLAAFVAAWCLLIDFLVHLNEDWERAKKGLEVVGWQDCRRRLSSWAQSLWRCLACLFG
jgi:hypothetical protein